MKRRRVSGAKIGAKAIAVWRCNNCRAVTKQKAPDCPKCGSWDMGFFHSSGECARYAELVLLQDNGHITGLRRQVKLDLHAYAPAPGNKKRIGWFIVDYVYHERDDSGWRIVYEDYKGKTGTKGRKRALTTDIFEWKQRHFQAEYGQPIKITGD